MIVTINGKDIELPDSDRLEISFTGDLKSVELNEGETKKSIKSYFNKVVNIVENKVVKHSSSSSDASILITVHGKAGDIRTVTGDVIVHGDKAGAITTVSGDVDVRDVIGGINTTSGDVEVSGSVSGGINTLSGDVIVKNKG